MSRVFKRINKKAEYNLYCLICLFAKTIDLRIISRTIKKLNLKLVEKFCPKLIKKL